MRQHNLRVTGSLTVNGENVVSASQLSALNSTLTGQYATTGSNMYNGNQTITGSLLVTGVITANEFHTTFVTSSVLYTSGSTKFGDSNDDIMEVTGSLKVNGNITANNLSGIVSGSSQITSLLPIGVVSGSSQLTASYDVRYVISGSITQTTWDNIASKPDGIVSSSAQVILQSTTGQLSASRVDGLNLSQIASGSYTASIGQTFNVNTSTTITGSLSVTSLSGSGINYLAYSGGVITAISGTAAIKYNQEFTATLGQTTFTPSIGYITGLIDVFYNGTKLSTTDYTASNGSTIVLSQGADLAGDIIEVDIYNPVSGVSNNTLRQQTTFTASVAQTTFTVNYTPGLLDVFFNGSRLSNEEYTANNGTSIILSEAATGGEIIDIFVYSYQIGAFSGVGGSGVLNQLAYWSSQSGLTGSNSLTFDGTTLTISGSLVPAVSGAYDLGSTSKPFRHIYVGSGSIYLVNNQGQVTNTISAQSIVTTDTLNSGSIDLTKSLPTGTVSGSSQIVGILTSLNTATASFSPRVSNLESKSSSVDISITNINSFTASNGTTSLNLKTGSYATTGSNTFFGTQTYSGSVYIANDLIVQGSSSIQYISASSVSIGTNIVQLNTANPSVRFAGLTIIDSGSVGGSGSFLYDSVQDEFIFVHRGNGTNITSSHFVLGPETYDSLGNETYLTSNIIPKGTGKEHLIDSCIFDNGTTTCIKNNLVGTGTMSGTTIYGSTAVCSPVGKFTSCIDVGSGTFTGGVTATSFNLGNGQYLRLTRNSGALQYDAFGIVVGTDNTRIISTNDFDIVNGGLVSQFKIAGSGVATFACSVGICNGGVINMTIPNGNNGGAIRMSCCTGANEGDMFLTGGGGTGILIAGSGKIGIGTTIPQSTLHIGPSLNSMPAATSIAVPGDTSIRFMAGSDGNANYGSYIAGTQTAGVRALSLGYRQGDGDVLTMTITQLSTGIGAVGIGISNPTALLHLCQTGQPATPLGLYSTMTLQTNSQANYQRIRFDRDGCAFWGVGVEGASSTNDFMISGLVGGKAAGTWSDSVLRIKNSNGAVLVNATSFPNYGKFNSYTNDAAPAGRFYGGASNSEGAIVLMVDKYSATTTTSQWFLGFTINQQTIASGVITANGASQAAFGSWSDRRLKENITDLPSQLCNILALRPVEFDYIESEGGGHQTSFIAQEFETIYPDAIGERPDGMKTITGWGKTEAILVKAIQEQQCTIQCLTNRIEQLENK